MTIEAFTGTSSATFYVNCPRCGLSLPQRWREIDDEQS